MKKRLRHHLRGEVGSEILEFAFVAPLLLVLVGGIVDFGFIFQRYEVVINAAREGVRIGSRPGFSATDVQNRVLAYVQDSGLPTTGGNPTVTVTPTTMTSGGNSWPATQVNVSYAHDYMLLDALAALVGGSFGSITLQAQMTMRDEVAGGGGL